MISELRAGMAVRRYHTRLRIKEETVGHHSANVCAILLRLDPNVSRELLINALLHDVPEFYTGDVPAPAKWGHPEVKAALEDAEDHFKTEHSIPEYYMTEDDRTMLKLADMLDLVLSSYEEANLGNKYAEYVASVGIDYIMGLSLPGPVSIKVGQMIQEVRDERKR